MGSDQNSGIMLVNICFKWSDEKCHSTTSTSHLDVLSHLKGNVFCRMVFAFFKIKRLAMALVPNEVQFSEFVPELSFLRLLSP